MLKSDKYPPITLTYLRTLSYGFLITLRYAESVKRSSIYCIRRAVAHHNNVCFTCGILFDASGQREHHSSCGRTFFVPEIARMGSLTK